MEQIDVAVIGGRRHRPRLRAARSRSAGCRSACSKSTRGQASRRARTTAASFTAASTTPPGTLKSKLCIEGRPLLYEFCAAHGVPHEKCGKLIVAADDSELPRLEKLFQTGVGQRRRGADAGRPRVHRDARAEHPRRRRHLLPETGIVERRSTGAGASPRRRSRRRDLSSGHDAARRRLRQATASTLQHRARDDPRADRRQRRRAVCRRRIDGCSAARTSRSIPSAASTRS